jgi:serine/threonine protein kinase
MSNATDKNLLFGIVALQMDFITGEALIAAMNAWILEKSKTLGEILVAQNALTTSHHSMLAALVDEHIKKHDDNPQRSLQSLSSLHSVRAELEQIADSEVKASLAQMPANSADDDGQPPVAPTLPLSAVTSSGTRFRILRPWAKGGLGKVSVAQDEELHREVALKEIQYEHAKNKHSRDRFLLEAEVTGKLEHPGIVPVYGLGHYGDGRPFYAMRFIHGHNLEEAIKRFHKGETQNTTDKSRHPMYDPGQRSVTFRELVGRFIDVCNAVAFAHSRGVLHRDLKPGNIMLGEYGETLVVDWGFAKVQGKKDEAASPSDEALLKIQSGSGSAPTRMGAVFGTPEFMSPEQAEGRLDLLGTASDVYSLGATLYAILTGVAPFTDRDATIVLAKVRKGEFPRPRQIKSEVPPALEAICLKAMDLKPADRYTTPIALADDLEHWLADEPVSAKPDTLTDRLFRMARRHRSVVIAATTAAMIIAIVASVATLLVNQQRRVANQLAQERSEALEEAKDFAKKAREKEEDAKNAAKKAKEEEDRAEKLATDARESASIAEQNKKAAVEARDEAKVNEKETKRLSEKLSESLEKEKRGREKAEKLSEILTGAMAPDDPTRFTGATFFAPKADFTTFTVSKMIGTALTLQSQQDLHDMPLAQAAVLDTIGDVSRQLALFGSDRVEQILKQALDIRRKNLPHDDPDVAMSCFHLACYYHERGAFKQAKPLYEEALEIRRKLPGGEALVADTLQNLAWLESSFGTFDVMMGRFEKALDLREKLLEAAPKSQRKDLLRDVVYTKLGMAAASVGKGHWDDAKNIAMAQKFRDQLKEQQGNDKLANALTFYVDAGEKLRSGRSEEAAGGFRGALDLVQSSGKEWKPVLEANLHYFLGHCLVSQNQLKDAELHFQNARQIFEDYEMFQIPNQGKIINEYASLLVRLGKFNDARKLWKEYLDEQCFRFGANHEFYNHAWTDYTNLGTDLKLQRD